MQSKIKIYFGTLQHKEKNIMLHFLFQTILL